MSRNRKPSSSPSLKKKAKKSDDNNSDIDDQTNDTNKNKSQIYDKENTNSDELDNNVSLDEEVNDNSESSGTRRSIIIKHTSEDTSPKNSPSPTASSESVSYSYKISIAVVSIAIFVAIYQLSPCVSPSPSNDNNWRLKVDPNDSLSTDQQNIIRASLKPILDKSSIREDGVSTLLILSSHEESAAKLARCILGLVNKETKKNQISTEIDLRSHRGGKPKLNSNLQTLLSTADGIRAVLLRRIDDIPSNEAFEQLRLLFAYCDGENPVIPHRLIIMTATSNSKNERELRENYKTIWPHEHDFIDALMSRISGHTLYVETDQKSIC